MDLDDVYVQIGEFKTQQKIYFFSLALFNMYAPLHMIQVVFTGQTPEFLCHVKGTSDEPPSVLNNTCLDNQKSLCERIEFLEAPDSFAKEWGLICDESYKAKLVQSFFMGGVGVGAVTLGAVADAYGRRKTLAATLLGMTVFGVAGCFIPWYFGFLAVRFLAGVFTAGNILSGFVLSSELIGPSKRGLAGNLFQMFFALGIILYAGIAYVFQKWRVLTGVASGVGAILFALFIFLPESPRWMITHDKTREAKQILRLMADRNGMVLPADLEISVPAPTTRRGRLWDLFTRRKTAISTVIQMFSWFVNSMVYYGLTLASQNLGSSVYISTVLSGVVELPAYVVTTILIDCVGRKVPLSMFMIMGGASCILIQVLKNPHVIFLMALTGKLCIAGSFAVIYIHSAELFPTVIRNSGLGLCSLFARVGGILAPFVSLADTIQPSLQFTIFGVLSLSSGLLNLMLEETLNRPLPETLDDIFGEVGGLRSERGKYARLASEELEDSEEELLDDSAAVFKKNIKEA